MPNSRPQPKPKSAKASAWVTYLIQLPLWSAVLVLVGIAFLVLALRFVMPQLHSWQEPLVAFINSKLEVEVELGELHGKMMQLNPSLSLRQVTLKYAGTTFAALEEIDLELDLFASFKALAPRFKNVGLNDLEVWLVEGEESVWRLAGWPQTTTTEPEAETKPQSEIKVVNYIEYFLTQGELNFNGLTVHLQPHAENPIQLSAQAMRYLRLQQGRQFSFDLKTSKESTQTASLVITLEKQSVELQELSLEAWLNFPLVEMQDFRSFWPHRLEEQMQGLEGQLSVQAWLSAAAGRADLTVQVRDVNLALKPLGNLAFSSADLSLQANLTPALNDWQLDWRLANFAANEYKFAQLNGRVQRTAEVTSLQLEDLDVTSLSNALQQEQYLPEEVRQIIADLNPQGNLKNIHASINAAGEPLMQANLAQVSVNAWEGAPAGAKLDGWLEASAAGGEVVFAATPLDLSFPLLYSHGWEFSQARGRVRWELDDDYLAVIGQNLAVSLPFDAKTTAEVSGEFAYQFKPSTIAQNFYLNLGLLPAPVQVQSVLVPDQLLNPDVNQWLNSALLAGDTHITGFIFAGALDEQPVFELLTNFSNTKFKFQPDWPALEKAQGYVHVRDSQVDGAVKQAYLGKARLQQAKFTTLAGADSYPAFVALDTKLTTPLTALSWLIQHSPLQQVIPQGIQSWVYGGQFAGDLKLKVGVTATAPQPEVYVAGRVQQGRLFLPQLDLQLEEVHGPLAFDLAKGFSSTGVQGKIFNAPFIVSAKTGAVNTFSFKTAVAAQGLKKHFQLPENLDIQGVAQVQGDLDLEPLGKLSLSSDLVGISFTSPTPWNKTADLAVPFNLSVDFGQSELPLQLSLGDYLSYKVHLDALHKGSNLNLAFKNVAPANLPLTPGLVARVSAPQLDLAAVYAWLTTLELPNNKTTTAKNQAAASSSLTELNYLDINLGQAAWDKFAFGAVKATVRNDAQAWQLQYHSDLSAGQVLLPKNSAQALHLNVDYLKIPILEPEAAAPEKATESHVAAASKPDPLQNFDPKQLPAFELQLKELSYGARQLGSFYVEGKPQEEGFELHPVTVNLGESQLDLSLKWNYLNQAHRTSVAGKLYGKDLAKALSLITAAQQTPVTSEEHQINFVSHWPASPLGFSLSNWEAEADLKFKKGRFTQVDSGVSGASKLLGLLNMDKLLRRLRLDFSDLTKKGVSYDSIVGSYRIEAGILHLSKPTLIDSTASKMKVTGQVDLVNETLDQELELILPVAHTLPLAAVIAGAPQVGAAIWVVQKGFTALFGSFTDATYKITGSLSDPHVELKKIL